MQLHSTLSRVFDPHPLPSEVKAAVLEFHKIACVCLRHKAYVGSLNASLIGLTIEDIAIDCIAPLFERDATGQFFRLKAYFERLNWESLSSEELLSRTRRLVFSAVHQGLCGIWGQIDPSLSKLLRNLKSAIQASTKLRLLEISGVSCVVQAQVESELKPDGELSLEYLEGLLSAYLPRLSSMKGAVDCVAEILGSLDRHRHQIPLMTLALALREVSARGTIALEEPGDHEAASLTADEISAIIVGSVLTVTRMMESEYVQKGKLDASTYHDYFTAISALLHARYAERDGEGLSLYTCLLERRTGLSHDEYRTVHRTRLEYLFRLTEQELLVSAKKLL